MIALAKNTVKDRETVFAYGFDHAGFTTRHDPIVVDSKLILRFIDFYSTKSLTEADGVIIPQGIFEKIETRSDIFSGLFGEKVFVSMDKSLMLEREREVFTLLRDGKWVCFLVGEITDQIAQGLHSEPIVDTDLCKRILNAFMIDRRRRYRLESPLELKVRDEEFERYMMRYGKPTTVFELPQDATERHAIAWLGNAVVGMEFDAQLYFLPFETSRRSLDSAIDIATLLSTAIRQYRRYRIVEVPEWVDEDFHFKSEEPLYLQINDLLGKVNHLESELASWKDYKTILSSSGMYLRNKLIALFESVFGFKVKAIDAEESFLLIEDDDSPLVLVRSEGIPGPVQKTSIDRLIRSRKECRLPDSFPAVLLVNNDMSVTNVSARAKTEFSSDLLEYATGCNVLIMRTIDMLFLINQLNNSRHKRSRMLHVLTEGRGWLKATTGSYDVVHP